MIGLGVNALAGGGLILPGDPHWDKVALNLNLNGANGSTSLIDTSPRPKTVTAVGSAQISTDWGKTDGSSLWLPNTIGVAPAAYVTVADHADIRFADRDFTIRFWYRPTTTGASYSQLILDKRPAWSNAGLVISQPLSTNKIRLSAGDSNTASFNVVLTSVTGVAGGTPVLIEVARGGGNWYLFLDGNLEASTSASFTVADGTGNLYLGGPMDPSQVFSTRAYIDNFQLTMDVARNTASYTDIPDYYLEY